jgi:hypothetical protein
VVWQSAQDLAASPPEAVVVSSGEVEMGSVSVPTSIWIGSPGKGSRKSGRIECWEVRGGFKLTPLLLNAE